MTDKPTDTAARDAAIRECALCDTDQECVDDGEAYICADRAACNARVMRAARKARAVAWLKDKPKAGKAWTTKTYVYDTQEPNNGREPRDTRL